MTSAARRAGRVLLTAVTYLVTLVIVAVATFVVAIVLAGPHAGLLPQWLEAVVLGAGWIVVLVVPALVARWVWRR